MPENPPCTRMIVADSSSQMLWTFKVAKRSAAPSTVSPITISVGPSRGRDATRRSISAAGPPRALGAAGRPATGVLT